MFYIESCVKSYIKFYIKKWEAKLPSLTLFLPHTTAILAQQRLISSLTKHHSDLL